MFSSAQWALMEPEVKRGRFFLASVEDERLIDEMRRLVQDSMQEGISESEFIHRARQSLSALEDPATSRPYNDPEFWLSLTPQQARAFDNDVTNINALARLRLIYRTQCELADGFAQWQLHTSPDELRDFPAWRFIRQPGAKTKRPDHVEHQGDVRLISDISYWLARNSPDQGGFNQPFPPWGFNSWMRVQRVSRAEAERLGLLKPGEKVAMPQEAKKWGLSRLLDESATTSLHELPPSSRAAVADACREMGIRLSVSRDGARRATPFPLLDPEADAALLREISELELLLQKTSTPQKKTGTSQKNALQSTTSPHGPDRPTDRRKADPLHRLEREQTLDHPAGVRREGQELRRRIHVPEVYRRLEKEHGDSSPVFKENQLTTSPHGRRDSQTGRRGKDGRIRRERELHPLDHPGGVQRDEQGLRRRIHVPEVYRRLEEEYGDSSPIFKEDLAATVTAQFNATLAGSKPAFLETVPGLTPSLAKDLPPGVRLIKAGGLECIYNEAAVAGELHLPAGADVESIVREKLESGAYGKLLGYGMDTMLERPCIYVKINRDARFVFGFMTSPDRQVATRYALQRLADFRGEFPQSKWSFALLPLPAP